MALEFKTAYFLDRKEIEDAIGKANALALKDAGFAIRRTARKKLRRKKGPSNPGEPPHVHANGRASLRAIQFYADPTGMVVGPIVIDSANPPPAGATVPQILEFGGLAAPPRNDRKKQPEFIEPRPFMGPSLEENEDKLIDFWSAGLSN